MSSSLHVILFGQTGCGKSSVINLIAGRRIAQVANGASGCTLSFKSYSFLVNGRTFRIWDTVGLNESDMELVAVEQACDLIYLLSFHGGVDLLIFCIRAPRITATSQANYRLFYEVLCKSRVPIAFVITHLEQEADMEKWWDRNEERLEKFGLKAASHACITGLPTHSRYRESRRKIARLLEGHNGDGRFYMPPDAWTIEFSRSLDLFRPLKTDSKREEIIRVLRKRCGMDRRMAEEVAIKMEDIA